MSASPKDFRLTAEQMAALNSLPADNTTGLKSALLSVSADRYIDPAFFEREKEAIFKRDPIPVAASGQLPQPGTFVRQDFMNLPLLLTRAKDGVVRAFLNVCRHRGAVLCPVGLGVLTAAPLGEGLQLIRPRVRPRLDQPPHHRAPRTTAASGTGNVTVYTDILMEADSYNAVAYFILVPGEGILAENGIYVGLPANITATTFYG